MEKELISIIVPVYNVENYLERCLQSLINQTYKNIEIVCVNDGSTDNSLNILNDFQKKDSRIKIISQENQGLSEARNVGIKNSSGKYIGFVDSDDWVDLDYYEKLYNALIDSKSDFACANTKFFDNGKISYIKFQQNHIFSELDKKIDNYKNGSVWDKLYKKSLFLDNDIKFIKGRYFEDNIVLLQLSYYSKKVVTINSVSYYYFNNNNSITREINYEKELKRQQDMYYMCEVILNYFYNKNISKKVIKSIKKFLFRAFASVLLDKNSIYYNKTKKLFGFKYIIIKRLKILRIKIISKIPKFIKVFIKKILSFF